MIPVYGFLQGDSLGILIFAKKTDTVERVITKLQSAAGTRVEPRANMRMIYRGVVRPQGLTMEDISLESLDRFDVVGGADV